MPEVKTLILILTADCNSRCSYCYQTAKKALRMDWPTLAAAIDLALDSSCRKNKIVFMGGEPLLEFGWIRKAVAYAKQHLPAGKSLRFDIGTNGLLLTDEVAAFLHRHAIDVQLSFDGIAAAQNYRKKGSFAAMDRLLDRLRERHPDLYVKKLRVHMTVIPATISYLSESVRYLIRKGIRSISLSPSCTPSPGWSAEAMQQLDEQFNRIFNYSLRYCKKTGKIPLWLFRKAAIDCPRQAKGDMCGLVGGRMLAVDVNGQAYGCAQLAESYQARPPEFLASRIAPLRMGDIRDPGFAERYLAFPKAAQKAELFDQKNKKYSSYGKCAECEYIDDCMVCPLSIGFLPGNTDPCRVPDFVCGFYRITLKHSKRFAAIPVRLAEIDALFGVED